MVAVAAALKPLRFSSEEELEVCLSGLMATDSIAVDGGALLITWTASRGTIALSGVVEERTYPALVGTLKRLMAGLDLVHVYLAGLEYCDLAGLRVIVGLAAAGDRCRQVVLHEVPPQLMAVMCILGWDIVPGLAVYERAEGRRLPDGPGGTAGTSVPAWPLPIGARSRLA